VAKYITLGYCHQKQVSIRSHRSDITTGGGTNSHRSDIASGGGAGDRASYTYS